MLIWKKNEKWNTFFFRNEHRNKPLPLLMDDPLSSVKKKKKTLNLPKQFAALEILLQFPEFVKGLSFWSLSKCSTFEASFYFNPKFVLVWKTLVLFFSNAINMWSDCWVIYFPEWKRIITFFCCLGINCILMILKKYNFLAQ